MRDAMNNDARAGERGAVSIKAVLTVFVLVAAIFLVIKVAPVYVEQRKIMHDVEELARIAAVRNWKEDKIEPEVKKLSGTYDLPDGSLSAVRHDRNVQITVGYTRAIDLLVTTYDWKVNSTIVGKEL